MMSRYSRSPRPRSSPIRSGAHPHPRPPLCCCDSTQDPRGRRPHGCNLFHSSCSDLCHQSSGYCVAKILADDSTTLYHHSPHGSCNHSQMMATSCVTAWNSPTPNYNDIAPVNLCPNALYIADVSPPIVGSPYPQATAKIAVACPTVVHTNGAESSEICASQNFCPGPSSSPQTVGLHADVSQPMFVVVPSKKTQQSSFEDSRGRKGSLKPMSVSAPIATQDELTYAIMPPGYYPYLIPTTSKKSKRKSSVKSESWKSKGESSGSEETSDSDDSSESSGSEDSTSEDSSESSGSD